MTSQPPTKRTDEVFCWSCGAVIKREAEICVHCGVRVRKPPEIRSTGERSFFDTLLDSFRSHR